MDRESRDVFDIIDEIQENLAIDVTPASWPIGIGHDFLGCYDMLNNRLELMDRATGANLRKAFKSTGWKTPSCQTMCQFT